MKKIILAIAICLFLSSTSFIFADDNKCLLNLQISNQSFDKPNENIALYLDGELVFDDFLPVKDQHYIKNFNIQVDTNKRHWIRIIAKNSNIESGLTLDLKENKYIYITYGFDKKDDIASFQFNINDEFIGID